VQKNFCTIISRSAEDRLQWPWQFDSISPLLLPPFFSMPKPLVTVAKQTDAATKKPVKTGVAASSPLIVAIGASAGGLEALEHFLAAVPLKSGLAFVVIQHLGPTYKGILGELLQRVTPMPVLQAGNRMLVKPDTVYVIPPNKDLSILHGSLYLLDAVAPRGLHLPIDFFFRALAEDQGERAIGVILSGMGSDGTLGMRAMKEKFGLTLAQEPATAKFNAMPCSAIDAGLADIVAPAEELPHRILDYLATVKFDAPSRLVPLDGRHTVLEKAMILLRARSGNDFSLYKKNTLLRRIERRMGIHQIGDMDRYVQHLRENPNELDLLFKELLIGVTTFFRDPPMWEQLQSNALPALLQRYPVGKALRAWVVACSTGEEAYSLAMTFKEVMDQYSGDSKYALRIFATDLDRDAIDRARKGCYPPNIAADVSPQRLSRFFSEEPSGFRINKEIREMVTFAPQNVIMDAPFTKLDILTCRNLLIYLAQPLQNRLLPLFHYAINRGGVLVLGSAETVGTFTNLFLPIDSKARIYQRSEHDSPMREVEFPTKSLPIAGGHPKEPKSMPQTDNLQSQADQFLLQNFSPAAVLINAEGDILYISGRTGRYLEPAAGKANWNIHAMAREELRHALAGAIKKAAGQEGTIALDNLRVSPDAGEPAVNVTVRAIDRPAGLRGTIMVVFTDAPVAPRKRAGRGVSAGAVELVELEKARDEIQSLREQMQTSHEELTSTNEELQSTNEELQSANEELTTSKEEMQSLNEELQTVNAELQSKVDDLSTVNNDMKNLLNSTEIATVFLDNEMNVRRFTTRASQIFRLIAGDVGRPLSDIVSDLNYPELQGDVSDVLQTLAFCEKQITTNDHRWFKVRIMPYRTMDNVIDGAVLTFSDITAAKNLESELRNTIRNT
jgi:chemotaxis protein methyltransferase CheR/two-component system CheB/CheR fusion protein